MTEKEPQKSVAKLKRKRKKRSLLNSILLFLCVFSICVFIFLSGIKSYTPTADVTLGDETSSTVNEDDLNFEIKSVDERLKWIQMEDDLPTVAIRDTNNDNELEKHTLKTPEIKEKESAKEVVPLPKEEKKVEKQEEKKAKAPKPTIKEIAQEESNKKTTQAQNGVIPLPTKSSDHTKVFLGNYYSLEDAMIIQKRVNQDFPQSSAFIKAKNDYYMVQLGSFSDKEKANTFIQELKEKGYNPKTL